MPSAELTALTSSSGFLGSRCIPGDKKNRDLLVYVPLGFSI